MKIRFSEHIKLSHQEGIIAEIVETFEANGEQVEGNLFAISNVKLNREPYLIDFLRQEEIRGKS